MEIPFELKIFSWIYEAGSWVLLLLLAGWFFCAWKLMCRARKVFFLWLLIFPLFLQPVQIAVVWCGWHYRMELRNRYAAYRIALETYGLPFYPELTLFDHNAVSVEAGALLIRKLLALPAPPSAVFCGTDKLAIGVMQTLRELKIKIPEEISIVGFDDISAASTCEIPLSTVHVPYFELGKAAVDLLFERIKSGVDVPSKTLMTNYVIRRTTAEYHG